MKQDILARLLRQPLLQFTVIGAVIFGVYSLVSHGETAPTEIRVGATELRWLHDVWQGQFGRPPSPEELRAAVKSYEDEEMRYREALALGLDRDDTIVRRRLAQKYDFLLGSQVSDATPTEAQLRAVYDKAHGRYVGPPATRFCQVYFGQGAEGFRRARAAVADLPPQALGDSEAVAQGPGALPYPRCYKAASPEDVARDFGDLFVGLLGKVPVGRWQGPVESGYGFHAVIVESRTPGKPLTFEAARRDVEADWRAQTVQAAHDEEQRGLLKRYHVTVDEAALAALTKAPAP